MAPATTKLTLEEFKAMYPDDNGDYGGYEYWYGEALFKGMPTWVHALLQQIIGFLLREKGYIVASELELRIDPDAFPRPDIVATRKKVSGRYPSTGMEIAVEIVSDDKNLSDIKRKSHKYQEWGFEAVYIVDPRDKSVSLWSNGSATVVKEIASIPCDKIWADLDRQYEE